MEKYVQTDVSFTPELILSPIEEANRWWNEYIFTKGRRKHSKGYYTAAAQLRLLFISLYEIKTALTVFVLRVMIVIAS